ncbi:MAG TPA: dihydropteroate synthase [Acidimicrobiia bacterium]|nr:dihydropteroate synthase [Acidimicrobiia bacterium]
MTSGPWRLRTRSLGTDSGILMGVVNVTPDSFSDGGLRLLRADAVEAGREMIENGADVIDVGGESTRPGSDPVTVEVELARVVPVIEDLASEGAVVSVDTSKPEVARAAVAAGAEIVNDVTAASATDMIAVLAESRAGVVLMHMKGAPRTMQQDPVYDDVVGEVTAFLAERARALVGQGVAPDSIALDPGIGFGKTTAHNLELIDGLGHLARLGFPVVLGASRKSFLGEITGIADPGLRDAATAVTTALGFLRGARVFRVHDVIASRDALRIAAAIVNSQQWDEWSRD